MSRILTLNIGASKATLAEYTLSGKRNLTLTAYGSASLQTVDVNDAMSVAASLPPTVSSRVREAVAAAMQKNKFDRTPSVRQLLSAIEKTHTLPVGYVLNAHGRRFRVVEILSEDNCSITYKVIEIYTLDDSLQRNDDGRPSTEITRSFTMVEYFCKDRDRRLDDDIATTSEASMDSPEHDQFLSAVSSTAKIPVPQVSESFNSHGEDSWLFVQANGTQYFIYEVKPQPPILKRLSGKINTKVLATICILSLAVNAFVLTKGLGSSKEELTAQVAKLTTQVDSLKQTADSLGTKVIPDLNGKIETLEKIRAIYDAVLDKNALIKHDIDRILSDLKLK